MRECFRFVAPYYCGFCRTSLSEGDPLCDLCVGLVRATLSVGLPISLRTTLQVYGVTGYEEPLKSFIYAKNRGHYEASVQMGTIVWEHTTIRNFKIDYLLPVPLYHRKLAQRGYNHAFVMAQQLSILSGVPLIDCVVRVKNTVQQSKLNRAERYNNLQNAFAPTHLASVIRGKDIMFVDDMMNSGATLLSMARTLESFEPKSMRAVVACLIL